MALSLMKEKHESSRIFEEEKRQLFLSKNHVVIA